MSAKTARRRLSIRMGGTAAAVLGVLACAEAASACTAVMGPLMLGPSSGTAGTTVMTSATGLKVAPAVYELHFAKGTTSSECMSFKGVFTLKTIATDSTGSWSNISVTIPSRATMGTQSVCGMETSPVKGATGTAHEYFTVT